MANAGIYSGATMATGDVLVDFRSDTVTRPTAAMRAAMAKADVGDDVYGDDPNINDLQDKVAALMGKEAALFVTSGTQSNLCAMMAHCQRGQEILTGENYHVFIDEAGGASVLGGIMMAPMPTNDTGALNVDDIDRTVKPDDPHCPISSLLCLENTVSGNVQSVELIDALALRGKAHGLAVHLDGARLMNAVVKLGVPVRDIVKHADSVSLCLSKGLGAPVGSVLAGSKELIGRAYRARKLVGGGMRQAGLLAAAGIHALDNHVERLADDHANALRLAEQLATIPQISVDVDAVQTNMVFMNLAQDAAATLPAYMQGKGILMNGHPSRIRLVTHLDVNAEKIDQFVTELRGFFA